MNTFDLSKEPDEMDEAELRSTLDEFMQKHKENAETFDEVEAERDEYSEKVEDLEAQVSDFSETEAALSEKFAAVVADETPMFDADEVAERFALGELIEKADAMGAFSLASDAPEGDDEAGEDGTFDEKPDKAPTGSGGSGSTFSDDAEDDLNDILGLDD